MQAELDLRWQKIFDQLFVDLKTANEALDWNAVGDVDTKIARALTKINKATALSDELSAKKAQLKSLHGIALADCRAACEAARLELLQQLHYAEARSAYLQTDLYPHNLP